MTFDSIREMALSLENVEEGTSYGAPAFKVRGVLFVRLREDGESLVVRVDPDDREEMMASDPETYYITDHYRTHPWVLVRLSSIHDDAMRDLLGLARRLALASKRRISGRRQSKPRL
jgi:hypothetical protein